MDASSFWHLDVGNVATWIGVLFACIAFIRRWSRRIDLMEDSLKSSGRTLEKLETVVAQMNAHGTNWSREKLAAETRLQEDHARRLIDMENAFREQSPQLAAMVTDVGWIKNHIQAGDKDE